MFRSLVLDPFDTRLFTTYGSDSVATAYYISNEHPALCWNASRLPQQLEDHYEANSWLSRESLSWPRPLSGIPAAMNHGKQSAIGIAGWRLWYELTSHSHHSGWATWAGPGAGHPTEQAGAWDSGSISTPDRRKATFLLPPASGRFQCNGLQHRTGACRIEEITHTKLSGWVSSPSIVVSAIVYLFRIYWRKSTSWILL